MLPESISPGKRQGSWSGRTLSVQMPLSENIKRKQCDEGCVCVCVFTVGGGGGDTFFFNVCQCLEDLRPHMPYFEYIDIFLHMTDRMMNFVEINLKHL